MYFFTIDFCGTSLSYILLQIIRYLYTSTQLVDSVQTPLSSTHRDNSQIFSACYKYICTQILEFHRPDVSKLILLTQVSGCRLGINQIAQLCIQFVRSFLGFFDMLNHRRVRSIKARPDRTSMKVTNTYRCFGPALIYLRSASSGDTASPNITPAFAFSPRIHL